MRRAHFEKQLQCCNVHFSQSKKHIRENTCFKRHVFCRSIGCFICFAYFQTLVFFDQVSQTVKKGLILGPPIQKVGPKVGNPEFWRGPKAQSQPATLYLTSRSVIDVEGSQLTTQRRISMASRMQRGRIQVTLWNPCVLRVQHKTVFHAGS